MAFSFESRKIIAQRAAGIDEVTGLPLHQAEAANLDHTKGPDYFEPENGLFVNAITHLWMHLIDEDNGLSKSQNDWAIRELRKRAKPTKEEIEIFGAWMRKTNGKT